MIGNKVETVVGIHAVDESDCYGVLASEEEHASAGNSKVHVTLDLHCTVGSKVPL